MSDSFATVLCLDCPPAGLEFGIDTKSWQGAASWAQGLHFVYFSQAQDGAGLRTGSFLQLGPGDVHVLQWDASLEVLVTSTAADTASLVDRALRGEFNDRLGPYPVTEAEHWPGLTSCITPDCLRSAGLALGALVVAGDEDVAASKAPGQVVPFFQHAPRAPRFAPVRERRVEGMSAEQVTQFNMSPDVRLQHAVTHHYGGSVQAYLGEFQLAFVVFMLLSSMQGLEQWKALLHLVAVCEQRVGGWRELALGLLSSVAVQLQMADSEFFTDELTGDNFLRTSLGLLVRGAMHPSADAELCEAGSTMQGFLRDRFRLALATEPADEAEEDRPAIVDAGSGGGAVEVPASGGQEEVDGAAMAIDVPGQPEEQQQPAQRMTWMVG